MTQFDLVQDTFDSGVPILVMKNGLWGLIDKDKNILIEPKYDYSEPFLYGFTMVKKNCNCSVGTKLWHNRRRWRGAFL